MSAEILELIEQCGGAIGTRYLLDKGAVRGDFGISGESTSMRVEVATKGIFRLGRSKEWRRKK